MNRWTVILGLVGCLWGGSVARAGITTFDEGIEGWDASGITGVSSTGGNPGACLDVVVEDSPLFQISNSTNPAFLGDYTELGAFRVTVDIDVEFIRWMSDFGEILDSRDVAVRLVDFVSMDPPVAHVVWSKIGTISWLNPGWHTYSIDVADPTAAELPEGWGAFQLGGDSGLPEGRTFASILESVDMISFTTEHLGEPLRAWDFDLAIDNVGVVAIPEPATLSLLCLGALALIRRRR